MIIIHNIWNIMHKLYGKSEKEHHSVRMTLSYYLVKFVGWINVPSFQIPLAKTWPNVSE